MFFLNIAHGVLVVLPGDTVHAGGFCFFLKFQYPSLKEMKFFYRIIIYISFFVALTWHIKIVMEKQV